MKRFVSAILLFTLLTSLPAQAATWFDDGEKLHRDPFCMEAAFSFDSFYTPSLEFASEEDARAHGSICECCTALVASVEGADVPVVWYYNPDGGKYLHRDAECPSVKKKYTPMTGTIVAERPDWMPENPCNVCGIPNPVLRSPSDTRSWNADAIEKAKLLPGVWTTPAGNAILQENAVEVVNDYLKQLLPEKQYVCTVAHYSQGGPGEREARATYKVIVTTLLRHPVCIVYVDALTGEVYHHQMAAEYAK